MHYIVVRPRTPDLQPRLARHAVAQRANLLAADLQARHVEEPKLWRLLPRRIAYHVHGAGTLDLVPIQHRIALPIERVVVAPNAHVETAGRGVIVEPVDRRRDADGLELVILE